MWSLLEFFPEDFVIDILDVGAALTGIPPYQSLVEAGRAAVIGFEPDEQECEKLRSAYGKSHNFLPYFAGDGGPAIYHQTNRGPTGSLLEPNTPLLEKFQNLAEVTTLVATHPVATVRIDDMQQVQNIDFIKIDVQGSELSVLTNATRAISNTVLIQVEVEFIELYKSQPLFSDVDKYLRGCGFQFHTFTGFGRRCFKPFVVNSDINAGLRQCIWSDAIYVRDWMRLDRLDELKLKKYAVLAHDVIKSYDLAHLVLSTLDRRSGGNLSDLYRDKLMAAAVPLN